LLHQKKLEVFKEKYEQKLKHIELKKIDLLKNTIQRVFILMKLFTIEKEMEIINE